MREKIYIIIAETVGCDIKILNERTNLVEELNIDSLQVIRMLIDIEDQLGIEIDFEIFELSLLNCLESFCEFLLRDVL